MLQDDAVPESPVPIAVMPNDIFNLLKGNVIMTRKSINADLVPIMIATEGTDFYDKNHTEKAADYIANIIAAKEIAGFTSDTLPRALRGRKVEMTAFTTKVLNNICAYLFLLFCCEN
jgi:hypothetical protein